MPITFVDILQRTVATEPIVASEDVLGGRKVVADLTALYALYTTNPNQMAEQSTIVYVTAENKDFKFIDSANATNAAGWEEYPGNAVLLNPAATQTGADVDVTGLVTLRNSGAAGPNSFDEALLIKGNTPGLSIESGVYGVSMYQSTTNTYILPTAFGSPNGEAVVINETGDVSMRSVKVSDIATPAAPASGVVIFSEDDELKCKKPSGEVATLTNKEILDKITRIEEPGVYNAFSTPIVDSEGTIHLYVCSGTTHVGRFILVDFYSSDNFKTYKKRVVFDNPAESYGDRAGGMAPDGTLYLFVAVLDDSFTATEFTTFVEMRVYKSVDNGLNYTIVDSNLPLNGTNPNGYPYGGLYILPDGEMFVAVYSSGTDNVWLLSSTDNGVNWTPKSTVSSGTSYNETTIVIFPGAITNATTHMISVSRASGQPEMMVSDDGGVTWTSGGSIANTITGVVEVSPWGALSDDGTRAIIVIANRSASLGTLNAYEYDIQIMEDAINGVSGTVSSLGTDAQVQRRTLYESAVNTKDIGNIQVYGDFGNPVIFRALNGQLIVGVNDISPLQAPPYNQTTGNYDPQQVDVLVFAYTPLKLACSIGIDSFLITTTTKTQVTIATAHVAMDNGGMRHGDDLVIPKDGYYFISSALEILSFTITTAPAYTRFELTIEVCDGGDPTGRQKVIGKTEQHCVDVGAQYYLEINRPYLLHKGDIIRFYVTSLYPNATGTFGYNNDLSGTPSTGLMNHVSIFEY